MTPFLKINWKLLRTRLYVNELRPRAFYLPAIVFILTLFATINAYQLYQFRDVWDKYETAGGNAFQFCESNRMDEIIRQPANTWSNFSYLAVGLFVLMLAVHDFKNKARRQSNNFLVRYPTFSLLYGISCIYLFAGSFLYHASLTAYFQRLDQSGMMAIIAMVLVLNLYKIFPHFKRKGEWRSSHVVAMLLAVSFNLIIFRHLLTININVLFPSLAALVICTGLFYAFKIRNNSFFLNYLYAAFLILFIACGFWILDRSHTLCSPNSMFQGHALWHIFTAVSIFFIYLYYRSGSFESRHKMIAL